MTDRDLGSATAAVPVAFVFSHARRGGSEKYLAVLLDQLGPAWIGRLVSLEDGPLVEEMRTRGHPVDVIPTAGNARALAASAWKLRRLLSRSETCVVHANGLKAAVVSGLALVARPIPLVWVKHDFGWDGWLARLAAVPCSRVVAPAHALAQTFGRRQRRKVFVVPNGIPEQRVDRAAGRRLVLGELAPDAPEVVIALVARLDPFKGHRELLAALPDVLARIPAAHVLFIGGGDPTFPDEPGRIRGEVEWLGLESRVHLLDHRDDAVALVSGCDVLVVASVPGKRIGREGASYVALEAMAAGTPVVAYADGGVPEVLGPCGVLVPAGDRKALADALIRVLEDVPLRDRLARCGRERVVAEFSVEHMAEAMRQTYRDVRAPVRHT